MLWRSRTTTETVFDALVSELFDRPIMDDAPRSAFMCQLVLCALGDGYRIPAVRTAGWDIESLYGTRIAVRQAAAVSPGALPCQADGPRSGVGPGTPTARFEIEGDVWTDLLPYEHPAGPAADVYILAWHGMAQREAADHRDRRQWQFTVVRSSDLAGGRTSIDRLEANQIAGPVGFDALRREVAAALSTAQFPPAPGAAAIGIAC